jgi:predicted MFS family arabinose efflux permease
MVMPYLSAYLVANVGCRQADLKFIYLFGGIASLFTLTPIGRWADRRGKLGVFRVMALLTILPLVALTNLPHVSLATIVSITTVLMVVSGGRMVPAMALMTASASPQHRGSFLSVNSSVQQIALGLAAVAAGAMIGEAPDGTLTGYPFVGALGVAATFLSVVLAGRLRPAAGGLEAIDAVEEPAPEDVPAEEGISAEEEVEPPLWSLPARQAD